MVPTFIHTQRRAPWKPAKLATRVVGTVTKLDCLAGFINGTTEQVPEQVAQPSVEHVQTLVQLTDNQRQIVSHADVPRSLAELMEHTGYSQRPYFKAQHIEPLLTGGILRMTVPDKPRSSKQRYVLTEAGIKLRAWRADQQAITQRTNNHEND